MDLAHLGGGQPIHRKAKKTLALEGDDTDLIAVRLSKGSPYGKANDQSRRRRSWSSRSSKVFHGSCVGTMIKILVYIFNPALLSFVILLALAASVSLLILKGGGWDTRGNDAGSSLLVLGSLKALLTPVQFNQSASGGARMFPLISEGTYNYVSDKILFACGGFVCVYTWILLVILKKYSQVEIQLFRHYLGRVSKLRTEDASSREESVFVQDTEDIWKPDSHDPAADAVDTVSSNADEHEEKSSSMDEDVRTYACRFEQLMESHVYARQTGVMILPIVGLAFFATTVFDLSYGYLFHGFCAIQFFLGWYFFGIVWNQADWAALVLTVNCARIDHWSVDITKARELILKKGNESFTIKEKEPTILPPPPPPLESQDSVHELVWQEDREMHMQPQHQNEGYQQRPAHETLPVYQYTPGTALPLPLATNLTNLSSGDTVDVVGRMVQRFDSYADLKGRLTTKDVWSLTKEGFAYPPEYSSFKLSSSESASDFSDPDSSQTGSEASWHDVDLEGNGAEENGSSSTIVSFQKPIDTMAPAIQSSVVKRKKTVYYLRKCINVLVILSCPAAGWLVGFIYMIHSADETVAPSRVWDIVSIFQYSNVFLMLFFGSTMNWELNHRVNLLEILTRSKRNEAEYERVLKISGCD